MHTFNETQFSYCESEKEPAVIDRSAFDVHNVSELKRELSQTTKGPNWMFVWGPFSPISAHKQYGAGILHIHTYSYKVLKNEYTKWLNVNEYSIVKLSQCVFSHILVTGIL